MQIIFASPAKSTPHEKPTRGSPFRRPSTATATLSMFDVEAMATTDDKDDEIQNHSYLMPHADDSMHGSQVMVVPISMPYLL